VAQVNEPTVLRSEVSASLSQVAQQRYPYFDGTERPYLTEAEVRSLFVAKGSLTDEEAQHVAPLSPRSPTLLSVQGSRLPY